MIITRFHRLETSH